MKCEMIKVRKDILEKLYSAIEEQEHASGNEDDITLGNIMEARDELQAGKTYEERREDRQ